MIQGFGGLWMEQRTQHRKEIPGKPERYMSMTKIVWKRPVGANEGFQQMLGPCSGVEPYPKSCREPFKSFKSVEANLKEAEQER